MPDMLTTDFEYHLPPHLIAQFPLPRGNSRLMVVNREKGSWEHGSFTDLPSYLHSSDLLVLNDTRVSARRLQALRPNGLPAEVLLTRCTGAASRECIVRPGRPMRLGTRLTLLGPEDRQEIVTVCGVLKDGSREIEFESPEALQRVEHWGEIPLPPYIHQSLSAEEEERYQTVYGCRPGSAAAPTAGLHFTEAMLKQLEQEGVEQVKVTLHVSTDTFRPVRAGRVAEHEMHGEWAELSSETADKINSAAGRVVAVGTTSVRTLESAAQTASAGMRTAPFYGVTRLFITPGYAFRAVDALLTNFHLPCSTLLMLVSALAGRELILDAYNDAVKQGYRFFSFGDAMLIL